MTIQKLKALLNTVIKQSTIDSSQITDSKQKFVFKTGSELEINNYQSADNDHWQLELVSPVNGVTKWFAYQPHVTILDATNDYTKNIYSGLVLDAYTKLEHCSDLNTPVDLPLSDNDGQKLFEQGILPILQSRETFVKATAEGQQKLNELVKLENDEVAKHKKEKKDCYYCGIQEAPCAYSVSCVMKFIAEKFGFAQVTKLFHNPFEVENIRVTGVEKILHRLGFIYFLKKDYLAPRGAIGARAPRWNYGGTKDGSGHIYFITKDGSKRTQFPNSGNENDEPEEGTDEPKWKIKDLHAENLHFFDNVYMQGENGYTDGFWLPPGIYPLKRS